MKIGLLARCDDRGISHQTWEFYKNMKPHRTLVICLNDPAWPEDVGRYKGPNVEFVNVAPDRVIEERKARKLLREIDVLFAVETLMDWRIATWGREMGVRTVVQGNPEFFLHHRLDLPHPTLWAWPTDWMLNHLPSGILLPVPAPVDCPVRPGLPSDDTLHVLHVAGHAAAGDRNATIHFMEALHDVKLPVHVTVVGQDHWLPEPRGVPRHVELDLQPDGVADRWQMYAGQHVVILPRKYGGLSLPAIEACRVGCAVVMPDCVPNQMWPGPRLPARRGRMHRAPYGAIATVDVDPRQIARRIDQYQRHRDSLALDMVDAKVWGESNTWDKWADVYRELLA